MPALGPFKGYAAVFAWLVVLTVVELAGAALPIPKKGIAILLLGSAGAKAALVALYFMHLETEKRWVWLLPGIPLVLSVVFVLALFPDTVFGPILR